VADSASYLRSCDQCLVGQPPFDLAQQRIHTRSLLKRAAVVAECELGQIAIKVFAANEVVDP